MEHLDATAVLQLHYVETRQLVGCILLEIRRLNKFMFGELSGSIFGRFKICKYFYKSVEIFLGVKIKRYDWSVSGGFQLI